MSSRTVSYIVDIVDRFSATAAKIAREAKAAQTSVAGMGAAVNTAEMALARLKPPPALAGLPGQFERAAAGANKLTAAVNNANAAVSKSNAAFVSRSSSSGGSSGGTTVAAAGSDKLGKGLMAWLAGDMALGAIDGAIKKAADVDTMLEKLRFGLGGDTAAVKRAYDAAFAMSGKHKNVTVSEALHIVDDLRSNLPEKFDKILSHDLEPFVKLHSFFKAWEGGKHSGNVKGALKDIGIAIRSGELMGNVTGEQIAKHAHNLAVGKVVFGEKFSLQEYFTAQKTAAAALAAADDMYKYVDFNAMTQRLGVGAGVSLATLTNKTVAGIMMRSASLEKWRELGLVNMRNVGLDKKGLIDPKSVVGKDWLAGGGLWGSNPVDAVMTLLGPAIGKKVAGLGGLVELGAAWKNLDVDTLTSLTSKIDKNKLVKVLGGLGYDRNATKQLVETILGAAALARDRQRWKEVLTSFENYQSYDQAKQSFSSQIDRLFQALTGRNAVPWVAKQINAAADAVGRLATAAKDNPLLRGSINAGGMTLAAYWAGRAATYLTRIPALGPLAAALAIGSVVAENWERVAGAIQNLTGLNIKPFGDAVGHLAKAAADLAAALGRKAGGDDSDFDSIFNGGVSNLAGLEAARRWFRGIGGQESWGIGPAFSTDGYWAMLRAAGINGAGANQSSPSAERMGWGSGLAASMAERQVHVRTTLDPISVTAPSNITITVSGPGLSGQANLPLSATAPRGQTTAVDPPGPAPNK